MKKIIKNLLFIIFLISYGPSIIVQIKMYEFYIKNGGELHLLVGIFSLIILTSSLFGTFWIINKLESKKVKR